MGRIVLNAPDWGKLPVQPAAEPENSVLTYRGAVRIWLDLPDHRFNTLAAHIGHDFHHHNARAEAEAAGRVLLAMMKQVSANTPSELLEKLRMVPRRLRQ